MGGAVASIYLCLRCRGSGHLVNECTEPWMDDSLPWSFCPSRKTVDSAEFSDVVNQPLCQRCHELNLLNFIEQDIPWESISNLTDTALRESGCIRSLGQGGSIVFRQDCFLCCCLFAMTPNPHSQKQEVIVFPTWTITCLKGIVSIDTAKKCLCARFLLASLDPVDESSSIAQLAQCGDALCILEDGETDSPTTLTGRLISSQHINIESAKQ